LKIEPTAPVFGGRGQVGKDVEFERVIDLPRHTGETLELSTTVAALDRRRFVQS